MSDDLIIENSNRAIRLNNRFCPYCFADLNEEIKTSIEHVIGRKFVPLATLENSWNLILKCCEKCNSEKADLEDDISAITLLTHLFFDGQNIHEKQKEAIGRKIRGSKSRYTGKAVIDSRTFANYVDEPLSGVSVKCKLVGLPQIDQDRLWRLLELHVRAFYFWLSYSDEIRRGTSPAPAFGPILETHKNDWGNPVFLHFMETTKNWSTRLHGIAAEGYFKVEMKKHPKKELRSYAFEYNKSYRCVGLFGSKLDIDEISKTFPNLKMTSAWKDGDDIYFRRREVPLKERDDLLFLPPKKADSNSAG